MNTSIENIKLFFQPQYLFNAYPGYDIGFLKPLLVFFALLLVASLVIWIISAKNKKAKPKVALLALVYNWLFYIGFVGLFLLFFRYEGIPYISMRFILFLWLVTFVLWGIYIVIFYFKGYKKAILESKKKEEKAKYFRKRK